MSLRGLHARGLTAIILMVALLAAAVGCACSAGGSEARGVLISTSLPLNSYVAAISHRSAGKQPQFFFPQLEIYDGSGNLIYTSHESFENAKVLKELPAGIRSLRSTPETARLAEVLEEVPDFRARKREILGRSRISVVSVFLEECHACEIQEDALAGAENRLLDEGVNLLVIRVSRP
jgi:hypothetical protein